VVIDATVRVTFHVPIDPASVRAALRLEGRQGEMAGDNRWMARRSRSHPPIGRTPLPPTRLGSDLE
jgi:hypothetical protein